MHRLEGTKELIELSGISVGIVSCGGAGDYSIASVNSCVSEKQSGSHLLMDTWYASLRPDFKVALSLLVTVLSKTAGERLVVDAGCKAISGERGLLRQGITGLKLKALHAEHAPIEIQDPAVSVEVGDKIEIAVHYHDGTINLHKQMYGVRNRGIEQICQIEQ